MAATLVVVRHGDAEGNRDHRFIGHRDVLLTDSGRHQARAVADRLADQDITRVVSSDLTRCVETVRPLAERLDLDVETDGRLREIDNGEWTGLLPEEIARKWPSLWDDYVRGSDVLRPSGERWSDVAHRVVEAVNGMLAGESTVVIGTHSGPILTLALWAAGIDSTGNIFRSRLGGLHNASITVIGPGPRLVSFNDVGHLGQLPDQRLPFSPVVLEGPSA
jgi:glucosyl-3-phosphoglycerate phosphatase